MSKHFLFLLLFALAIRLFWIALIPVTGARLYPFFDADGYLVAAEAFQKGAFLDNSEQIKRMPLYPALSAFFPSWFFSQSLTEERSFVLTIIRIWHTLLDVCTVACLYLLVRRGFGERSALIAGLLYAVYPLAWYRIPVMNTEIIQGTAVAFWLLGATRLLDSKKTLDAILMSLLSAVMAFISPALQFIPLFFSLFLFLLFPWRESLRLSSTLLLPFLVISMGWGMRNYAVAGEFFLFDTRGGKEFWLGNNQETEGRWEGPKQDMWIATWQDYIQEVSDQGGGEREINKFLYRKGIEQILSNPAGAIVLFVKKFFRFWYVPASEQMLSLTIPLQTIYIALAFFGLLGCRIRRPSAALPLFLIGYYCAIYTLSYACIRFSLPVMPWVCALAGAGLNRVGLSRATQNRFESGRKEQPE